MRILGIIVFVFIGFVSNGQISFFKLYSDSGDDAGHGIIQLEDSSYMVTGSSSSFLSSGSQAFLLHVDSVGKYLWSTHYGGAEAEVGRRVMHLPGDGFYIAGYTNSIGAGGYDYYLVKTDESGVQQWEKAYGKSGWERVNDAALTSDNGVIMVGETNSNPTDNKDGYIVRTDSNGDTLWTHTFGSDAGDDYLSEIEPLNDSVFYMVGRTYVQDSLKTKAYIMKMKEDGTLLWSDTIGSNGEYGFNGLHYNGTEIMVVGERIAPGTDVVSEYFYRHDPVTESVIFQYHNDHPQGINRAMVVTSYGDPNQRYIGYQYFNQFSFPDGYDVSIAKANEFLSWQANAVAVNYPKPDYINELIKTSDGGAIGVGKTNSEGEGVGVNHVYLAKIGPGELYPNTTVPHVIDQLVSVSEELLDDGLTVYPNPASTTLLIEMPASVSADVTLINGLGQVVWQQRVFGGAEIAVSDLRPGIYYLQTNTNGIGNVRKIAVRR